MVIGKDPAGLTEIDALTCPGPPFKPPPAPLALTRTLVIRNTRARPEETGGRIGTPLKVTEDALTMPWNTFAPGVVLLALPATGTPVFTVLLTVVVPTHCGQPFGPAPYSGVVQTICGSEGP